VRIVARRHLNDVHDAATNGIANGNVRCHTGKITRRCAMFTWDKWIFHDNIFCILLATTCTVFALLFRLQLIRALVFFIFLSTNGCRCCKFRLQQQHLIINFFSDNFPTLYTVYVVRMMPSVQKINFLSNRESSRAVESKILRPKKFF